MSTYLRRQFGRKVYKLSLDGGFTCPNRDGSIDTRGCIFCSAGGSGEFSARAVPGGVAAAIEKAKERVRRKTRDGAYIAYFQSFTGTYAPLEYLRDLYSEAINEREIVALSVGTRPDCLPPQVVELLAELNKIKPVWVELGLQTVKEKTAQYIRRGYALPVFDDALRRLRAAGLTVIVHMIIGLPGETEEDIVNTARYIGRCGAQGVKLQLMHVLRGTDLAEDYAAGKFPVLGMEEYARLAARCIRVLPEGMVIHRLTGDGDKRILIAPQWSGDKKRVLNYMRAYFDEIELRQGEALAGDR